MAKGGMLPLLALGVGALLLFSKSSAASSINTTPSTAANGLPPGTGKYDSPGGPVMPMQLQQTVDSELANDTNATNLTTLADALSPMWPTAVALLNAKAAQLQATPPATPPSPAPAPVVPVVVPTPAPVPAPAPVVVVQPPNVTPVPAPTPTPVTPAPVTPAPVTPAPVTPAPVTPAPTAVAYPQWATTAAGQAGMTSGPDVSSVAIPANYAAQSDETEGVQTALNAWASQVGSPLAQLTVDGLYGAATQQMAAMFQQYVNDTSMAPVSGSFAALTVDGLAGPDTQNYLLNFGTIPTGGPY